MLGLSHKTVFLLDHAFQMREPCGLPIELDASTSSSRPGSSSRSQFYPAVIPPVIKSLWTSVVENTLEYARILWDVYADQRVMPSSIALYFFRINRSVN
jgi:hypothetical protein